MGNFWLTLISFHVDTLNLFFHCFMYILEALKLGIPKDLAIVMDSSFSSLFITAKLFPYSFWKNSKNPSSNSSDNAICPVNVFVACIFFPWLFAIKIFSFAIYCLIHFWSMLKCFAVWCITLPFSLCHFMSSNFFRTE